MNPNPTERERIAQTGMTQARDQVVRKLREDNEQLRSVNESLRAANEELRQAVKALSQSH